MKRTWIIMLAGLLLLAGCSKREVPVEETETEQEATLQIVSEMDAVENGAYYVCHNGTYEKLYVGAANYEIRTQSNPDENRTLWFKDDFERIPTMYQGDTLIYKNSAPLVEDVYMERFEYCGYTVGLSGLKRLESGRYSLSMKATDHNINPSSDAMELTKLGAEVVIIDRFGGADLRSGNVSYGGCILGLSKDKVYAADVYVGTYYHEMRLTADTIALTSMEAARTVDYEFLQNQLISIHIPEWYNSGYYLINGFGLVRYVAGDSYNEDTDFNIPNIPPEEQESEEETEKGENNNRYYENETKIRLKRASEYCITIRCFPKGEEALPGAILYEGDNAFQFKRTTEENVLRLTEELSKGNHLISVSGLEDGYYEIEVEDLDPEETSEEESK